jgi:hypothetical protein
LDDLEAVLQDTAEEAKVLSAKATDAEEAKATEKEAAKAKDLSIPAEVLPRRLDKTKSQLKEKEIDNEALQQTIKDLQDDIKRREHEHAKEAKMRGESVKVGDVVKMPKVVFIVLIQIDVLIEFSCLAESNQSIAQ